MLKSFLASTAAVLVLAGLVPSLTAAQASEGALRLMREPHSYTDVADAFDGDDPFDLNVLVGFERSWTYGNVQRETRPNHFEDVAHHEHTRNSLLLGLDIGLFRDLAAYARLPIILSDDRSLRRVSGRDPSGSLQADDTIAGDPADRTPPPLFEVGADGFHSPTRSGFDYLAVGLAWAPLNQYREPDWPTWVLMVEGRFNLPDPLVACARRGDGTACREGTNPGMSQGTNALRIETRASFRSRNVEPYFGLLFHIEWPGDSERFFLPANNVSGFVNDRPPIRGQLTGGLAIIPWEDRGAYQRFTIDLRFLGTYVSEGHGYSPLFDALGTSQNRYLTEPTLEGSAGAPGSGGLRSVDFYGLTDMQAHAQLGGMVQLEMQAARFLRFTLGAGLWYITPHFITYANACNPNVSGVSSSDPRTGTCRRGIVNPHHRSVLDLPGQRFRMDEQVRLDLYLAAMGQF